MQTYNKQVHRTPKQFNYLVFIAKIMHAATIASKVLIPNQKNPRLVIKFSNYPRELRQWRTFRYYNS